MSEADICFTGIHAAPAAAIIWTKSMSYQSRTLSDSSVDARASGGRRSAGMLMRTALSPVNMDSGTGTTCSSPPDRAGVGAMPANTHTACHVYFGIKLKSVPESCPGRIDGQVISL